MLYILLFLVSLMPAQALYGMLGAPLPNCPMVSNSSFTAHRGDNSICLVQPFCPQSYNSTLTLAEIHSLPLDIRSDIVRDKVLKAVDAADTDAVRVDFSGWMNWLMPREYYRAAAAYSLLYAAQQSPKKTAAIVKDLLTRVDISELIEPDQLVRAAMDNNHAAILEHVQKVQPELMAGTLALEIVGGNPNRVHALLKAGVQPVNNPVLRLPFVLVQIALDVFALPNQPLATSRLEVIDLLVKHTDAGAIPASYTFDLSKVPAALQQEVAERLARKQFSASTALIEVFDAKETHLHKAANERDYSRCFEYLTQWSGPLNKHERVPVTALLVLHLSKKDSPAYKEAAKEFAQFTTSFQELMENRLKISKEQLLAQDAQGRTPQEVAQANGASRELVELLNPKNHQDAKLVLISTHARQNPQQRVIIPTEVERIPVLAELDPIKDKADIEALKSTHAQLTGLVKQYESLKEKGKKIPKNHTVTNETLTVRASLKETLNAIVATHKELLGMLEKLENTNDRGVRDTIVEDLKKRTDLESANLKVAFGPMPKDNLTGTSYKVGDFVVEDGALYIIDNIQKAK